MTSQPQNVCHHTHTFNDIKQSVGHHPHYMYTIITLFKHHVHILWHHTTLFMTSLPLYLKWHPPFLCHHNDSIDVLRPTVCMTSNPPYVCHLMHFTQCHIHSLWLHNIIVITLHPLHSWQHTTYIWQNTHGNTNVVSAIWPTISNTTSTVSVSSNQGYQLYHTHSLYDITHSMCDIVLSMHAITTNVYDIIPLYV